MSKPGADRAEPKATMTGVIATIPRIQFSNALGLPLAGGKLTTYLAGTTTPEPTYQDQALTIENETTITLDSTGSCVLWLDPAKTYKLLLKSALGVTQPGWPVDNISGAGSLAERLRVELASANGSDLVKHGNETVGAVLKSFHLTDYAALRNYSGNQKSVVITGYFVASKPTGAAGMFVRDDSDVASADNGGTIIVDNAGRRWKRAFDGAVQANWFGADPTGAAFSTTAILAAIASMRANPVSIASTIGGGNITAYSSGKVELGLGVYKIEPGLIQIAQDLGLIIQGQGSRRTNNAVQAPTTLLVSGGSAEFGLKADHSGGRGLTLNDFDLCYADSTFTGDLLDIVDCPGVTLNSMHLGTFGVTGATRLQTARSCIRGTYDEFLTCNNCVFNGAVDGVWFDDARTESGNPFGGSITTFNQCVWYDFTNTQVRHDGLRTRTTVIFNGCAWNPISVNCVRALDLNNVEGLVLNGGCFTPSVANRATVEWMRLSNCTGIVKGVEFNDLSKAGTLSGMIEVSGNRVFATDGFTLKGGIITGRSNEFSKGATGWTLTPDYPLTVGLGLDLFKAEVTRSYDIPADSSNLSGHIAYDQANDASVSKFRNASGRVRIENVDRRLVTVGSAAHAIPITDTGRTILAAGGVSQNFALPAPVPGTSLTITKVSGQNLTVSCAAGTNFYGTGSIFPSSGTLAGTSMGTLALEAYSTVGWLVKSQVGAWTFA